MGLAKLGKRMLSSLEQVFVGRDEKRAPLKTPAWEAIILADFLGKRSLLQWVQRVVVCDL